MTQNIKALLDNFLLVEQKNNWKLTLLQNWSSIIGKLHDNVRIEKIENDTIVLVVSNSSWMQEMYLLSDVLLKKINAQLDQPRIKKIFFKKASKKTIPLKEYKKSEPLPTREIILNAKELQTLENIKDDELREVLKSFLIRCHRSKKQ